MRGFERRSQRGGIICEVGGKGTVVWDEILTLSEGIVQPYGCFLIWGDGGLVKREGFGI